MSQNSFLDPAVHIAGTLIKAELPVPDLFLVLAFAICVVGLVIVHRGQQKRHTATRDRVYRTELQRLTRVAQQAEAKLRAKQNELERMRRIARSLPRPTASRS